MYFTLKFLHVASAAVFLGNIVTGLFWKRFADGTGDTLTMATALQGLARSDLWFTWPAAALLIVSGVGLAWLANVPLLGTLWIGGSLLLFAASGLLFALLALPLQRKLLAALHAVPAGLSAFTREYERLSLRWELWGALSISASVGALALMVMRPGS